MTLRRLRAMLVLLSRRMWVIHRGVRGHPGETVRAHGGVPPSGGAPPVSRIEEEHRKCRGTSRSRAAAAEILRSPARIRRPRARDRAGSHVRRGPGPASVPRSDTPADGASRSIRSHRVAQGTRAAQGRPRTRAVRGSRRSLLRDPGGSRCHPSRDGPGPPGLRTGEHDATPASGRGLGIDLDTVVAGVSDRSRPPSTVIPLGGVTASWASRELWHREPRLVA